MLEVAVQCVLGVRESNESEGSQRVSMHTEAGNEDLHSYTHGVNRSEAEVR
jgi:hypothetical protein